MRLTKESKKDIIGKLVDNVMAADIKAERKLTVELCRLAYKELLSEEDLAYMDASPRGIGAFPTTSYFYVNLVDPERGKTMHYIRVDTEGDLYFPVYFETYRNGLNLYVSLDSQLGRKFLDYESKVEQRRKKQRELHIKADAILKQVTTLKRLQETWPELSKFLPDVFNEEQKTTNLPAVQVTEVTELIKSILGRTD